MNVVRQFTDLVRGRDFRRFFAVRFVSQLGDGLLQMGLATLFFFNPQNLATAAGIAGAFALLLAPFTLVGPLVGPFIDRLSRRQIVLWANLARAVLTLAALAVVFYDDASILLYTLALVILGVNRFILAALGAALPRVVDSEHLLLANTLVPTLGAAGSVTGGFIGFLLGLSLDYGHARFAALACAVVAFLGAATLALRLGRNQLGPSPHATVPVVATVPITAPAVANMHANAPTNAVVAKNATTGNGDAARTPLAQLEQMRRAAIYMWRRGTPGAALAVMGAHRFLYGVSFLALILMSRNLLNDPGDTRAALATFGMLAGISFAGNGLAIFATPGAGARLQPRRWVVICLLLGAASQAAMLINPGSGRLLTAMVAAQAALVGFAVQGAKIAVDTVIQRDTHDSYRGRAFALYDTVYNAAFILAAALAAYALPDTGYSRWVFAALAGCYGCAALTYARTKSLPRPLTALSPPPA